MFVAVARITLSIPESNSLKSKRHVLHKVVDKVKARFNVSIAEVADNDLWQKATLGVAAVANDHAFAQESVDKVTRFIEELYVAPVVSRTSEVIAMGGDLFGSAGPVDLPGYAESPQRTLAEVEQEEAWREGRREVAEDLAKAAPTRPARRGSREPAALNEVERRRAIEDLRERLRRTRRVPSEEDDEGGDF